MTEKIIIETDYICPKCGGRINKVIYQYPTTYHSWHRWTCSVCQRDYGYNVEKPSGI
jgi:rubredoxin